MPQEALSTEQDLDYLQGVTVSELIKHFQGSLADKVGTRPDAKLAMGTLSALGRIKATERAADHTQLEVIRAIAENQDEVRQYITMSMPHLSPGNIKGLKAVVKKK